VSVSIIIVTHGRTGQALIEVAEFILGGPLSDIRDIPFTQSESHTTDNRELRAAMKECDDGDGMLILTDLVGASPANHVSELLQEFPALMVSGINLAMLLRVWNYRDQNLEMLANTAVEGGKRGIEAIN
jgi:PTS system mannose-specific IIA component